MRRVLSTSRLVRSIQALTLTLALTALLVPASVSAAANGAIYLTPASGSYPVGATIAVSVRENSGGEPVNAAQADLSYSANLQYLSTDASSSDFGIGASSTGGNGSVSIARGTTTPLTDDKLIAVVNFKVTAAGQASIQMLGTSQVLSNNDSSNIVATRSGSSYTAIPPSNPPTATPTPTPTPSSGGTKATTPPSTTITTKSTASGATPATTLAPTSATNGSSSVELSGSTSLETTPTSDKPIAKVEYYLGKKLVATVTAPPYKYTLDTKDLRNGNYTLTTKTYYTDNTLDATNTAVVVKNPFSAKQLWLQLRHYAWLVVIVIIVVADAIWILFRRRKNHDNGFKPPKDQFTVFGGDNSGSFNNPGGSGPSSPVAPSAPAVAAAPPAPATPPAPVAQPAPSVSGPTVIDSTAPNTTVDPNAPKVVSGDGGIK